MRAFTRGSTENKAWPKNMMFILQKNVSFHYSLYRLALARCLVELDAKCWKPALHKTTARCGRVTCTHQLQINMWKCKLTLRFTLHSCKECQLPTRLSHLSASRAMPRESLPTALWLLGNMQIRWRGKLWLDMQPPGSVHYRGVTGIYRCCSSEHWNQTLWLFLYTHTHSKTQTIAKQHTRTKSSN